MGWLPTGKWFAESTAISLRGSHGHVPTESLRRLLKPYRDHSSFQMLSGMNSLMVLNLAWATVPILFVPEPKKVWITTSSRPPLAAACFDRLPLAGYTAAGEGRYLIALFRSRLALRRDYYSTGQRRSVKVGGDEGIRLHYHRCYLSSYPTQSMQVPWLLLQV